MARAPWAQDATYDAAREWVDRCLRTDDSLFTPGRPIWTSETIARVVERLAVRDTRKLDFTTKLHDQVGDLPDEAIQFTAELLYVHALSITNMAFKSKRELVEPPLGWMHTSVTVPDELLRCHAWRRCELRCRPVATRSLRHVLRRLRGRMEGARSG